jgi:hypothetical protein
MRWGRNCRSAAAQKCYGERAFLFCLCWLRTLTIAPSLRCGLFILLLRLSMSTCGIIGTNFSFSLILFAKSCNNHEKYFKNAMSYQRIGSFGQFTGGGKEYDPDSLFHIGGAQTGEVCR